MDIFGGHHRTGVFLGSFLYILGLFLKVKVKNWIFFFFFLGGGGCVWGVLNFKYCFRLCLIFLIFFFFFWGGGGKQ